MDGAGRLDSEGFQMEELKKEVQEEEVVLVVLVGVVGLD